MTQKYSSIDILNSLLFYNFLASEFKFHFQNFSNKYKIEYLTEKNLYYIKIFRKYKNIISR